MRRRMQGARTLGLLVAASAVVLACSSEDPAPGLNNDAGSNPGLDAGAMAADAADAPSDSGPAPDGGLASDAGAPGDAGQVIMDQCDPVTQDCAGADDKCVVENDQPLGGAQCVPESPNDVTLGDECTGQDCASGLACVRLTASSTVARCVKVCRLETGDGCDALGAEYECRTRLTDTNWGACRELPPLCDPYDQTPCAAEEACQPFLRRTGTWEFRCRTAGQGTQGDACGAGLEPCMRNFACVADPGGNAQCRRICQVTGDCSGTAQCTGSVAEPPFMYCAE